MPTNDEVAVCFNSVTKRFGKTVALHEVSMAVRRGEFMTLIGSYGCGKTTLLNLAAGFFSPDGGEILIGGERVNDVPTYRREKGKIFCKTPRFSRITEARQCARHRKRLPVPHE